jgi:hypothetical protein
MLSTFKLRRYSTLVARMTTYYQRQIISYGQGLTLVHFTAEPEPFLIRNAF